MPPWSRRPAEAIATCRRRSRRGRGRRRVPPGGSTAARWSPWRTFSRAEGSTGVRVAMARPLARAVRRDRYRSPSHRFGRPDAERHHRGRGAHQVLRRRPCPDRRRPHRRGGHRLRPARTERRRQDHHGARPHHAPQPRSGVGSRGRVRRRHRADGASVGDRPRRPVRSRRRDPHRAREPGHGRAAVPPPHERGGAPSRRDPRAVRPRRRR